MLRPTKFFRSLQSERPNRQDVVTNTDILPDNIRRYLQQDLIPMIQQKSKNAQIDRIPIRYYQQNFGNRLCSCWKKEYENPEANCIVCFGTGRVGGYNVYGTQVDVIDATRDSLVLANVTINDEVWPWRFELVENALSGFVEAIIDVPSLVDVDILHLYSEQTVNALVRTSKDAAWHKLSRGSLLSLASASKQLVIRLDLMRDTEVDPTPSFTHLYLRYKLVNTPLYVDMPRFTKARNLDNFSLTGLQTTMAFISSALPLANVGDFFRDMRHTENNSYNYMWKVVEVQTNDPLGINTSWDLNVRAVEPFEIYGQVP